MSSLLRFDLLGRAWEALGTNLPTRLVQLTPLTGDLTADTPTSADRVTWIDLLDEMAALRPELVVPGHRLPDTAADATAITHTRDYLLAFEEELAKAADGAALIEALVKRYPDNGMLIGAKVAKGEMTWG